MFSSLLDRAEPPRTGSPELADPPELPEPPELLDPPELPEPPELLEPPELPEPPELLLDAPELPEELGGAAWDAFNCTMK